MGKRRQRGSKKRPVIARSPAVDKSPRVREDVDFWSSRPVWRFSQLDLDGFGKSSKGTAVGWSYLRREELGELLERFKRWETMTWQQLLAERSGRKRNHLIPVESCSKDARKRLQTLKLDDIDEQLSLSVNSLARVFGILDRGELKLLWWDPNHLVCPSQLKHT